MQQCQINFNGIKCSGKATHTMAANPFEWKDGGKKIFVCEKCADLYRNTTTYGGKSVLPIDPKKRFIELKKREERKYERNSVRISLPSNFNDGEW